MFIHFHNYMSYFIFPINFINQIIVKMFKINKLSVKH